MITSLEEALKKIAEHEERIVRMEKMLQGTQDRPRAPHMAQPHAFDSAPVLFEPRSESLPLLDPEPGSEHQTTSPVLDVRCAMEIRFNHILEKISLLWDTEQSEKYLESVAFDDRGDRRGFDFDVMEELMLLEEVCKMKRPPKDIWEEIHGIGDRA